MSEQYELYCLSDLQFYDRPDRLAGASSDFPIAGREAPDGWASEHTETWIHFAPREASVAAQGWKIHVSSRVSDAERALAEVWDYCVPRGIPFKFLRSPSVLVMLSSKSAHRGSSGKLVTIYPRDEAHFERVLEELDARLRGIQGPYVLSDLRYREGPLYVRYGGFTERRCLDESGESVLAIEDDQGRLVPDVRGPIFALPPWMGLPVFLEPHLAARNAVTVAGLPYEIESVLHFSNGGGVYLGREVSTQRQVVLKEGRPHAGLDVSGRDAVARIGHERDILERLAGLDVVPALIDYFTLGDHHFLVEEFLDGNPLQRLMVHRFPLTHPDASLAARAEYADWALEQLARVEEAVAAIHERGVVFGDLHPDNILIGETGRMMLIDFEVSTLAADRARSALAHPGYGAPHDRTGVEVDHYALACMRLGMFAPQTTMLLPIHRPKVAQIAALAAEAFSLPPGALDGAVRTILGEGADPAPGPLARLPMPGEASWEELREALARAILASATPERDDRLFPGDIDQFDRGGGINLANGAAGVLYALAITGAGSFPEHEEWLRAHAVRPGLQIGLGFWDGMHGVAYALEALGHRQDALDAVERCLAVDVELDHLGLHSGLAGIGLNLLHLGERTGEPALLEAAERIVDLVADRLGGPEDVPEISGGDFPRAGLMYGSSGPALLFMRAYEQSGDPALLDLAEVALRQDLRRCMVAEDGTLQVNQDWRSLPYLDEGSAGIALALGRYLAHREDEDLVVAQERLEGVLRCGYFVQPGLFAGRAGILAWGGMRARAAGHSPEDGPDPESAELIRWLRWHALPYAGGLAFPGDQLLRLSMDLATGSAGVLLALGAALHDGPVFLPFTEPPGGTGELMVASPGQRHAGGETTSTREEV